MTFPLGPRQRLLAAAAILCGLTAGAAAAGRSEPPVTAVPAAATPEAIAQATPPPATIAGTAVVLTLEPVNVRAAPDPKAPLVSRIRAGILLPVGARDDRMYRVLTPCELRGWVDAAKVAPIARSGAKPDDLSKATVLIDPGHGGALPGAVGPTGLTERDVNLDISRRLALMLREDGVRVMLTRATDHVAGLRFRTTMANLLGAHAFVSIHHNAQPDGKWHRPGTETYYQVASSDSKRLAGLAYEEILAAFARYDADWVADRDPGAKVRVNSRGDDFYAVLRNADVPSVLLESLFITNPTEEALLRREDVRIAEASAIYKALVRYFETDDPGSGFVVPYSRGSGSRGALPTRCVDPG